MAASLTFHILYPSWTIAAFHTMPAGVNRHISSEVNGAGAFYTVQGSGTEHELAAQSHQLSSGTCQRPTTTQTK